MFLNWIFVVYWTFVILTVANRREEEYNSYAEIVSDTSPISCEHL